MVFSAIIIIKYPFQAWVINLATLGVGHQILLADISDIRGFLILRQKVVKWLVPVWANGQWNGFVPLFAIGEHWVDIENDAAKMEFAVHNNITNRIISA